MLPQSAGRSPSEYLGRLLTPAQMELDYACSQMVQLCVSPATVFKMTAWRKQTKNQWARDDPGFVFVLLLLTFVSSLAYGVAFHAWDHGIWGFTRSALHGTFQVVGFGSAMATWGWYVSNTYLRVRSGHTVEQRVEWLYAFDIHCNAFFPFFIVAHVAQFFLLPLLLREGWVAAFGANALYGGALSLYVYITFLGYTSMPFLKNTHVFIYPLYALSALLLLLTLFEYNMSHIVMAFYFPRL